jgi:hypothetical protein
MYGTLGFSLVLRWIRLFPPFSLHRFYLSSACQAIASGKMAILSTKRPTFQPDGDLVAFVLGCSVSFERR